MKLAAHVACRNECRSSMRYLTKRSCVVDFACLTCSPANPWQCLAGLQACVALKGILALLKAWVLGVRCSTRVKSGSANSVPHYAMSGLVLKN